MSHTKFKNHIYVPGDLVRLTDDIDLKSGYGLILQTKYDYDDIYDLYDLSIKIRENAQSDIVDSNDFFPSSPMLLILWGKSKNNVGIWMYCSEIILVTIEIPEEK